MRFPRFRMFAAVSALVLLLAVLSSGCRPSDEPVSREELGLFDTRIEIRAYGKNAKSAVNQAFDELRRLHNLFDVYDPNSEISKVNSNAGKAPVKVSPDTLEVVDRALYFARISDGAFDPTVLPLVKLWNVGGENPRVPQEEEIRNALALVDYRKVLVDRENSTIFLEAPGMGLDLGGIAKGYAVDKIVSVLRKNGVTSFLINAGGNVYVSGRKPGDALWRVGITDPLADPSGTETYLGIFTGTDISVVSSGDYQRYFEVNGVRYHHILDPKTGYPARGLRGTTVIGVSSTDCDGLSTTLFVLGVDKGKEILSAFPGVGAIFVKADGSIEMTPNLKDKVDLQR
ncbi:MAG: FAD:protein FMN transferase [Firmicutes bacterium]|nr:FAD:protein FMN transferase [Candidatus Fermentithermobacillaceae bacterium]